MSKNCFIILSCIDSLVGKIDPGERDRYNSCTLINCYNADNDADIFLVDSSVEYDYYKTRYTDSFLTYHIKNLKYQNLADYDPPLTRQIVHESKDKKYTESFAFRAFVNKNFEELQKYKFITVCSSRYITEFNVKLYEEGKIYFKQQPVINFSENESLYSIIDTRKYNNDNFIRSYCSHAYAFDSKYLHDFLYVHEFVMHICRKGYNHISLEQCLYSFTNHLRDNIVEVDWVVDGFDDDGTWYRY